MNIQMVTALALGNYLPAFAFTALVVTLTCGLKNKQMSAALWRRAFQLPFILCTVATVAGLIALFLKSPPPYLSLLGFAGGTPGALISGFAAYIVASAQPRKGAASNTKDPFHQPGVVRGVNVVSAQAIYDHQAKQFKENANLEVQLAYVGGVGVDDQRQCKHFLFMGATGTGKSNGIRQLLNNAERLGHRAIIADADGGYLARYYNPARGDIILNPFDERGRRWDLTGEVPTDAEADQLAASLIVSPKGGDSTWVDGARVLLGSILRQSRLLTECDAAEVYRLFTSASREELSVLLEGTAAAPYLHDDASKFFQGLRSSMGTGLLGLEYASRRHASAGHAARPFSITRWAKSNDRGWVFLSYRGDQISSLRTLISAWMRLAIFATMSRPEGDSQTWFVADEADALGKIDGLDDALQRVRKFGGRAVVGFQSLGKLQEVYGKGIAAAVVENCQNKLIFRCSAETAEAGSRVIGEQTIWQASMSQNQGSSSHSSRGGGGSGTSSGSSTSQSQVTRRAIMPAEIEGLPDLNCYLTCAGWDRLWVRAAMSFNNGERKHAAFEPIGSDTARPAA